MQQDPYLLAFLMGTTAAEVQRSYWTQAADLDTCSNSGVPNVPDLLQVHSWISFVHAGLTVFGVQNKPMQRGHLPGNFQRWSLNGLAAEVVALMGTDTSRSPVLGR